MEKGGGGRVRGMRGREREGEWISDSVIVFNITRCTVKVFTVSIYKSIHFIYCYYYY